VLSLAFREGTFKRWFQDITGPEDPGAGQGLATTPRNGRFRKTLATACGLRRRVQDRVLPGAGTAVLVDRTTLEAKRSSKV
jgi:hypothetical protein